MDNPSLTDLLNKLAGQMSSLSAMTTDSNRNAILQQEDTLANLALVIIAKDLNATTLNYRNAVSTLNAAINTATEAMDDINKISGLINDVGKAIGLVQSVIATV